jgi:hypothetical protein
MSARPSSSSQSAARRKPLQGNVSIQALYLTAVQEVNRALDPRVVEALAEESRDASGVQPGASDW